MKIFYFIIFILLVYSVISYARVVFILKTNRLPAISQQSKTLGQGEPLVYVAAGDSTAAGVGASDQSKTYTYLIANKLSENHLVNFINIGVSGARTKDLLEKQIPLIIAQNPDIITLSIGANDVTHLYSNERVITNIKTILEKLETNTHAQIYVATMPILKDAPLMPWPYRKIMEIKSVQINAKLDKLSSDRIHIAPVYDFGWGKFEDLEQAFSSDQFHPSDLGYTNWANAFFEVMKIND